MRPQGRMALGVGTDATRRPWRPTSHPQAGGPAPETASRPPWNPLSRRRRGGFPVTPEPGRPRAARRDGLRRQPAPGQRSPHSPPEADGLTRRPEGGSVTCSGHVPRPRAPPHVTASPRFTTWAGSATLSPGAGEEATWTSGVPFLQHLVNVIAKGRGRNDVIRGPARVSQGCALENGSGWGITEPSVQSRDTGAGRTLRPPGQLAVARVTVSTGPPSPLHPTSRPSLFSCRSGPPT